MKNDKAQFGIHGGLCIMLMAIITSMVFAREKSNDQPANPAVSHTESFTVPPPASPDNLLFGPCGSPDAGNCFIFHGSPGCSDATCCNLICGIDPFCCNSIWDELCADSAVDFCNLPTGACCLPDGSCTQVPSVICGFQGGAFQGDGTDCTTAGCPQPSPPCPADCAPLNADGTVGDGVVQIFDLISLIGNYGPSGGLGPCDIFPENADGSFGNGNVNINDLIMMINNWGPCP